jgi:hypothetical protein
MTSEDNIPFATDFSVDRVQRLLGEGLIALLLKHATGRRLGFALSEQEATVLLVRLIDALRSDDKGPQDQRTLYLDRESSASSALPVKTFHVNLQGDEAILIAETEDKLQIPLSFPASNLAALSAALVNAAKPGAQSN